MADTATASVRLPARQRRQQLLDVALGVFSRLGYHETSMNALASEAGVTKPVLYQHFARGVRRASALMPEGRAS